jgi:hypothetical protein
MQIWAYNTTADSWTALAQSGFSIATSEGVLGYDANQNKLILWIKNQSTTNAEMWEGQITNVGLNVPITVQESIYTGGYAGGNRTNEPVCQGIPIADSAAISSTSVLGLSGATAGQFRSLGTWPSGHIKWVQTCAIIPSLTAGSTAAISLNDSGSGNFGGSNLASDLGTTISVDTGAAVFSIKKANFNVFDTVSVGGTSVMVTSSSQTRGVIVYGPSPTASYPGNVTCSPTSGGTACTTVYSSANDGSSTVTIEQNGPVMAVLKADYTYTDNAAHTYGSGTMRMYFFKGKVYPNLTAVAFKNANYGTSGTFATAFKGHQGIVLALQPNYSGTLNWSMGNETGTPTSGTMSGSDDVYLYQAQSTVQQFEDNNGGGVIPYTTDTTSKIVKNGSNQHTWSTSQAVKGWCDIADSGGKGVTVGVYQLTANWPKGCEFSSGGATVQIGLFPPQNSIPYYMEWPAWNEIVKMYVEFHTTNPSSVDTNFQNWQAFLLARPTITYINSTGVFPHPLISASDEDTAESGICSGANPNTIPGGNCWSSGGVTNGSDTNLPGTNPAPNRVLDFSWNLESEYRWGYMMTWFQRGWAAHYLEAQNWYNFQSMYALPHSDGFNWRDHGPPGGGEINGFGFPTATSANQALGVHSGASQIFANHDWRDQEHGHWYGQTDYYFISGDDFQKDAMLDQQKDWFLLTNSVQDGGSSSSQVNSNGTTTLTMTCCTTFDSSIIGQIVLLGDWPNRTYYGVVSVTDTSHIVVDAPVPSATGQIILWNNGLYNSRSIGTQLLGVSRFSAFLQAIGDSSYSNVNQQGVDVWNLQVKAQACASGYPIGCDPGTYNNASSWKNQGVHRKRGFPWGQQGGSGTWCGISQTYRVNSAFQAAILAESIINFQQTMGSGWSDYWTASDMAYGISDSWALQEAYVDNGSGQWDVNGFRFGVAFDVANDCNTASDLFSVTTTTGSTAVTNVGTKAFNTNWDISTTTGPAPALSGLLVINGVHYKVSSVADINHLTLSTAAVSTGTFSAIMEEFDFLPQGTLTTFPHFFSKNYTDGSTTDWSTKMNISMQKLMASQGTNNRDFQGYQETQDIYLINNPGKTLNNLTITSFTNNGGGSYTIGWTTPASTDYLRIKWAPSQIVDRVLFDAGSNTFTTTSSNTPWFAAYNWTSIPSPVTGSQSVTITGLPSNSYTSTNFSVKAKAPAGCNITPTSLGPYTVTQTSGFGGPLVANSCSASSFACSGLPTGLSVSSSTGALSGTLSAAGTFTPTCTYSTASQPYTIIVNVVPVVTTSGALTAGVTGDPYDQTIVTSGGTGTITCALFSGSLTGSGLTVGSNCHVTGTAGAAGIYGPITVKATDSNGVTSAASSNITIPINPAALPSISGQVSGGNIRQGGAVKQ